MYPATTSTPAFYPMGGLEAWRRFSHAGSIAKKIFSLPARALNSSVGRAVGLGASTAGTSSLISGCNYFFKTRANWKKPVGALCGKGLALRRLFTNSRFQRL